MTALNQAQASAMDAEQKLRNLGFERRRTAADPQGQGHHEPTLKSSSPRSTGGRRSGTRSGARPCRRRPSSSPSPTRRRCGSGSTSTRGTSAGRARPTRQLHDLGKRPGRSTGTGDLGRDRGERGPARPASGPSSPNRRGKTRRQPVRRGDDSGRRSEHKAVVVPKEAVQRKDNVDVVFLPEGAGSIARSGSTTKATDRSDVARGDLGPEARAEGRDATGRSCSRPRS